MIPITPTDLKLAANDLPPSPQVFGKLGKLLRDPFTGLNDITDLVNTDASLTARVLRLSNSALYGHCIPIDTLDDAINRVGFRAVFKLVGVVAVSEVFSHRNVTYSVEGSLLWENALCCGLAMETLAQKLGMDEQEAYTLGLLRSFGKLVINTCVTKQEKPISFSGNANSRLVEWEEEHFGLNNPQAAGFLLSTWNFPADTIDAIQNQYTPEAATQSKDAAMLNLAALIAENLGKALPGESKYWESAETYLQQLGLNGAHLEEAQEYAEKALESVIASVAA
jgi:HD-like signal output (HDOD) protein